MGGAFSRNPKHNPDFTPLYYKVGVDIKDDIESGRWAVGEAIPSARRIAQERNVSLGTVEKAIENLVNAGYLYRVQGKGTFVAGTVISGENLRYYRMRTTFRDRDPQWKIRLVSLEVVPGRPRINRYLKIRPTNQLYRLGRTFILGRKPLVYNVSYLPRKMFKDFEAKVEGRLEKTTLYQLVETHYGLPTIFNQELIDLSVCDQETAAALEVEEGRPVLRVEMLSTTFKDRPYEYRLSYCLPGERRLYREIEGVGLGGHH